MCGIEGEADLEVGWCSHGLRLGCAGKVEGTVAEGGAFTGGHGLRISRESIAPVDEHLLEIETDFRRRNSILNSSTPPASAYPSSASFAPPPSHPIPPPPRRLSQQDPLSCMENSTYPDTCIRVCRCSETILFKLD